MPPFKLARLQQKTDDTKSTAYQRQMWEALRKSINGLVNKVNVSNITQLVQVSKLFDCLYISCAFGLCFAQICISFRFQSISLLSCCLRNSSEKTL